MKRKSKDIVYHSHGYLTIMFSISLENKGKGSSATIYNLETSLALGMISDPMVYKEGLLSV